MKNCELCKIPARTYCESDQACLCWDCDAKVHGANFLVARHSRTLLCHACQSPTPWKASGAMLGNTVSLCETCAGGMKVVRPDGEESEGGNDDDIVDTDDDLDDDDSDDSDDDGDDDEGAVGDEDGDNQVVPLSSTPPPPASNSSSSEGSVSRCNSGSRDNISETVASILLKRRRDDASDDDYQDREWKKQISWISYEGGDGISTESSEGEEIEPATNSASSNESPARFDGSHGSSDDKTTEAV